MTVNDMDALLRLDRVYLIRTTDLYSTCVDMLVQWSSKCTDIMAVCIARVARMQLKRVTGDTHRTRLVRILIEKIRQAVSRYLVGVANKIRAKYTKQFEVMGEDVPDMDEHVDVVAELAEYYAQKILFQDVTKHSIDTVMYGLNITKKMIATLIRPFDQGNAGIMYASQE